jgi:hypothetical protein
MIHHDGLMADAKDLFDGALHILDTKGRDYAPLDDALHEFRETAELLGITPEQVWGVHFMKQVRAVLRFVKDGKLDSEGIESRLGDVVNYAAILRSLHNEKEL